MDSVAAWVVFVKMSCRKGQLVLHGLKPTLEIKWTVCMPEKGVKYLHGNSIFPQGKIGYLTMTTTMMTEEVSVGASRAYIT